MNFKSLLSLLHKAGEAVREIYFQPFEVYWKGEDDPLTQADLKVNAILTKGLQEFFPEDGILSEEEKQFLNRRDFSKIWIIDPIDGTKEFIDKNPEFAISLGLAIDGKPELGFIINPATTEAFYGGEKYGLYFTPNFLSTPYQPFSFNFETSKKPRLLLSRSEVKEGLFEDEYWQKNFSIQAIGSIAYKLALLAFGRADVLVSVRPKNEWDVCGGIALVKAAGLECLTLQTLQEYRFNEENLIKPGLLAGKKEIISYMIETKAEFLKNSYRPRK